MYKIFLVIFGLLLSPLSFACTFPIHGAEYDALINISKNQEIDSFHIELPKKLDDSESAKIYLAYSKVENSVARISEFSKELTYWFSWRVVNVDFVAPPKDGYVAFVHVTWSGEVCDTVASSKILFSDK